MNVTEKALKAAYRRYLRGLWPETRQNCPPSADLVEFFRDDSPRRHKNRILDHIAGCGACAEEFEILLTLDRKSRAFSAEVARLRAGASSGKKSRRMNRGFFGAVRWALAGAGLAAAVLILWLRPPGAVYSPDDPGPLRSVDAVAIIPEAPSGRVDTASSLVFRWRIEGWEKGTMPCVVVLYDDSLLEIWRSRPVQSNRCALPEDVRKALIPERAYFWGISSAPGTGIFESDLATFSVKRRSRP